MLGEAAAQGRGKALSDLRIAPYDGPDAKRGDVARRQKVSLVIECRVREMLDVIERREDRNDPKAVQNHRFGQ